MEIATLQCLTLAYGSVLCVGGYIGYTRFHKGLQLLNGGLSLWYLCFVCAVFSTRPAYASLIGLGHAAFHTVSTGGILLVFARANKKIFSSGVICLTSLLMSGVYLHGLLLLKNAPLPGIAAI